MKNKREHLIILRLLKGAPLSVLYALQVWDQPMEVSFLYLLVDYSQEEVASGLLLLKTLGLAAMCRDGTWLARRNHPSYEFTIPEGFINLK